MARNSVGGPFVVFYVDGIEVVIFAFFLKFGVVDVEKVILEQDRAIARINYVAKCLYVTQEEFVVAFEGFVGVDPCGSEDGHLNTECSDARSNIDNYGVFGDSLDAVKVRVEDFIEHVLVVAEEAKGNFGGDNHVRDLVGRHFWVQIDIY